jgi:hypothetical protein
VARAVLWIGGGVSGRDRGPARDRGAADRQRADRAEAFIRGIAEEGTAGGAAAAAFADHAEQVRRADRYEEALHDIAEYTDQYGDWSTLRTAGAVARVVHAKVRAALSGADEGTKG